MTTDDEHGSAARRILLSPPDVGELEQEYVLRAMRSGWVAPAGPDLNAFEREVADRVGVPHAVGLASGTAALHLVLVSWGVGQGDVVPVSTFTFAATVNAIRYVGAEPFFIDSDAESGNMSPALLARAVDRLHAEGRRVPAVIPVDLLGKCADYNAIEGIAREFGVRVLADAAESLGASYRGRPAGSWGDAAVLSFNGNKIMTTSGGGMLLTADAGLAAHVRKLSTQAREPVLHYEHTEIGYNYRLSNILAALGRAQLARLDDMVERRRCWRATEYRRQGIRAAGRCSRGSWRCPGGTRHRALCGARVRRAWRTGRTIFRQTRRSPQDLAPRRRLRVCWLPRHQRACPSAGLDGGARVPPAPTGVNRFIRIERWLTPSPSRPVCR